jgi:hypothetical protein
MIPSEPASHERKLFRVDNEEQADSIPMSFQGSNIGKHFLQEGFPGFYLFECKSQYEVLSIAG